MLKFKQKNDLALEKTNQNDLTVQQHRCHMLMLVKQQNIILWLSDFNYKSTTCDFLYVLTYFYSIECSYVNLSMVCFAS